MTDAFLRRVAGAAGVNADDAFAGADSQFAQRRLDRANADAQRLGIDSTPTFTVAKGSGAAHVLEANALDPSSVATALDGSWPGERRRPGSAARWWARSASASPAT